MLSQRLQTQLTLLAPSELMQMPSDAHPDLLPLAAAYCFSTFYRRVFNNLCPWRVGPVEAEVFNEIEARLADGKLDLASDSATTVLANIIHGILAAVGSCDPMLLKSLTSKAGNGKGGPINKC